MGCCLVDVLETQFFSCQTDIVYQHGSHSLSVNADADFGDQLSLLVPLRWNLLLKLDSTYQFTIQFARYRYILLRRYLSRFINRLSG